MTDLLTLFECFVIKSNYDQNFKLISIKFKHLSKISLSFQQKNHLHMQIECLNQINSLLAPVK